MQIMRHAGLTRFLFATAFALTLAEGLANTSEQTDLTARSGGSGRCSKDSEDRRCAPKNLSYSIPAPFLVGQAIMPLKPTVTGIVLRYRVSPQLPIGLVISHTSGIISGSPTATTPPRTYVITASNEAGRTSLQLTLSVLASAPPSALSYSPTAPFLIRKAISPVVPTVIGTATTYVVVPGLPAGISISATTGVISGTPSVLAPSTTYTVTAFNPAGSATFGLQLEVDSGPTVYLSATATDAYSNPLSFRWRTTDGLLTSVNGASATWLLPGGPGFHFAYLLVSNGVGGYSESRVAVNTDQIGNPIQPIASASYDAPPAPAQLGDFYRAFVTAGYTRAPSFLESFRQIRIADLGVLLQSGATQLPATGYVQTNLQGGYVIPNVPPVGGLFALCSFEGGLPNAFCGPTFLPTLPDGSLNVYITMLNSALTDYLPGPSCCSHPFIVGSVSLADGAPCGISNALFDIEVTATASLLDSSNTIVTGPFRTDDLGGFAIPDLPLLSGAQTATSVQIRCESTALAPILLGQLNDTPNDTDLGPSTLPTSARPSIVNISALYNGVEVGAFEVPSSAAPSDIITRPDAFLAYKGIDSRRSACQYYKAIGAVKSCDASGEYLGAISFEDWKRTAGIDGYAPPSGPSTLTAFFINKEDLNLAREHHSISYGPGQTTAYVCNHQGPSVLNPEQSQDTSDSLSIDTVIDNTVAGRNLIACVAMDYTSTSGVNNGQPFTRFLIFGPGGQLLPSVNLDQRGEKFVPGACVACHGADHYAGKFPEDGSGPASVGGHFLPYDQGNFEFSSKPGLSESDQQVALFAMNQNVLNAGPTPAEVELIAGWYSGGSNTFDKEYLPLSWQGQSPKMISFYRNIEARNCRTCHVALMERFNFDHYDNYGSPRYTAFGFFPVVTAECGGGDTYNWVGAFSMPNSLVTFNRFWSQFGAVPTDQTAQAACQQAVFP